GTFLTGPIQLKSGVDLNVDAGAMVLFSRTFADYPLVRSSYEGLEAIRSTSPIWGSNLKDVSITGRGTFDGSGDAWRPVKKNKLTAQQWEDRVKSGGIVDDRGETWYPSRAWLGGQ